MVEHDRDLRLRAALRVQLAPLSPRKRAAFVRAAGGALAACRLATRGHASEEVAALRRVGDDAVEAELERCARLEVRLLVRGDPAWPPGLDELADPPELLWVRGEVPSAGDGPPVTIVGPRRATAYGLALSTRLARELSELGAVIVSGGARGVDGAAHAAALDAGGRTVVVLGCGVDVSYPPEHRGLFDRIAAEGALVSEFPCGARPLRHRFPVRNRLLAGWSAVVVLPEAGLRSGSLVTARLALEAGREVCAVPGPVTSPASRGTNELLARGARVTRGIADVIAELPEPQRHALVARAREEAAEQDAAPADPLLASLPEGRTAALDELVERTGLGCGELLARLVRLEAAGCVRALPGGSWLGLGGRAPRRDGRAGEPPLASPRPGADE
jgi:DNA processing protein